MEKLVMILNRSLEADVNEIARQIQELPGLSVTATSKSLIDVEAVEKSAVDALQEFARSKGISVQPVSQPKLIEPISPFKYIK